MRTCKLIFTALVFLALSSSSLADPYSLGWEEVNASEPAAKAEYTLGWDEVQAEPSMEAAPEVQEEELVEPPVAVNLSELPGRMLVSAVPTTPAVRYMSTDDSSARVSTRRPEVTPPRFNIELSSYQHFDHYNDRYRQVEKVEVVTYRGGFPQTETHENFGGHTEYDVFLNDMKPGDRYQVRVIWDDGSYRDLDRTIDRFPEENVVIDEPVEYAFNY